MENQAVYPLSVRQILPRNKKSARGGTRGCQHDDGGFVNPLPRPGALLLILYYPRRQVVTQQWPAVATWSKGDLRVEAVLDRASILLTSSRGATSKAVLCLAARVVTRVPMDRDLGRDSFVDWSPVHRCGS
jgi:hypothetical protein